MAEKHPDSSPAKTPIDQTRPEGAAPQPPLHPPNPTPERLIEKAVEAFLVECDALAETLRLVMPLLSDSTKAASNDYLEFLVNRAETTDDGVTYHVQAEIYAEFTNLQRRLERNKRAIQIIPRSFFTSLISHYDAFIGNLLRAVFYMKPEALNSSEREISFKQLLTFESIEAARDSVVDAEVETLLRQSHADQFKWMEGKFNVPLRKDLLSWPTFIEITERRNLFVHCNGVVSSQYLEVCKRHGVDCSKLKVGVELGVPGKYFNVAHATVVEIGVKLAYVLWRR